VRGGWRDLVLPEVSITPAAHVAIGWFSIQSGADILFEPSTGNRTFHPFLALGAKFDESAEFTN
jgi:hypothetical protein